VESTHWRIEGAMPSGKMIGETISPKTKAITRLDGRISASPKTKAPGNPAGTSQRIMKAHQRAMLNFSGAAFTGRCRIASNRICLSVRRERQARGTARAPAKNYRAMRLSCSPFPVAGNQPTLPRVAEWSGEAFLRIMLGFISTSAADA